MRIAVGPNHAGSALKQRVKLLLLGDDSAHPGVEHHDGNVLVMGGRVIGESVALELVSPFLESQYDGVHRHSRRLDNVKSLEGRQVAKGSPP